MFPSVKISEGEAIVLQFRSGQVHTKFMGENKQEKLGYLRGNIELILFNFVILLSLGLG